MLTLLIPPCCFPMGLSTRAAATVMARTCSQTQEKLVLPPTTTRKIHRSCRQASQPGVSRVSPHTSTPVAAAAQPQQNEIQNPHRRYPRAPGSGEQLGLYFWATQEIYLRLLLYNGEIQLIYLICRNKHRKSSRMRRERNIFQMKE